MSISQWKILSPIMTMQNLVRKPTPTTMTYQQLQAKLDESPELLRQTINSLIDNILTDFATNVALQQVIAGQVNIVDPNTGKKYIYVVINGSPGIKEVA